jgi:type II secretory pathway component PulF
MRIFRQIIGVLFWSLAAGSVLFAAAVIGGFLFAPAFGYFAVMAVIGLVPLILSIARLIRRRRAVIAISYLEQAVRLNLPLPRMLRAATQSERGVLALRLAALRQMLEEGYPVGMAVESAVPEVNDRDVSVITASERVGRLPQALRRLVRENALATSAENERATNVGFFRAYPLVMTASIGAAVSLYAVFVLPKYEQIMKDFGMRMPPVTRTTMNLVNDVGVPIATLILLYVLIASGRSMEQVINAGRMRKPMFRWLRDHIAWATPFLHGMERDRSLADAFELIAEALAASTPINRAVFEAGKLRVNVVVAKKLQHWFHELEAGQPIAQAARNAWLPRFVWGMLAQSGATASAADVFSFLARYYRSRFSRTAAVVEAAGVPLLTILFGIVVAFVTVSVFMPLVTMIQSLSAHAGRWVL